MPPPYRHHPTATTLPPPPYRHLLALRVVRLHAIEGSLRVRAALGVLLALDLLRVLEVLGVLLRRLRQRGLLCAPRHGLARALRSVGRGLGAGVRCGLGAGVQCGLGAGVQCGLGAGVRPACAS